eukprot:CAMPEP_0115093664 /NCGR_PEP_ID=MMETSP0227-20121206/27749_1 /TAXON_ID=89957 /ORGANISM="Polarella glacialis, Strain CCMP 1383" /LENGTH=59 /DNA_ID=CAMNT_0002486223 /DNA_START=112 /DNA_END=288 /DNA_ORIENTATION=-
MRVVLLRAPDSQGPCARRYVRSTVAHARVVRLEADSYGPTTQQRLDGLGHLLRQTLLDL